MKAKVKKIKSIDIRKNNFQTPHSSESIMILAIITCFQSFCFWLLGTLSCSFVGKDLILKNRTRTVLTLLLLWFDFLCTKFVSTYLAYIHFIWISITPVFLNAIILVPVCKFANLMYSVYDIFITFIFPSCF